MAHIKLPDSEVTIRASKTVVDCRFPYARDFRLTKWVEGGGEPSQWTLKINAFNRPLKWNASLELRTCYRYWLFFSSFSYLLRTFDANFFYLWSLKSGLLNLKILSYQHRFLRNYVNRAKKYLKWIFMKISENIYFVANQNYEFQTNYSRKFYFDT